MASEDRGLSVFRSALRLRAALFIATILSARAHAQTCSQTAPYVSYIPYGASAVTVIPVGGFLSTQPIYDAMATWNSSCRGGGPGSPNPFPYFVQDSSYCQYCVTVELIDGHGTLDPETGEYPEATWSPASQTIYVYKIVGTPGNPSESQWRSAVALQNTIEHELGHVLGLGHSGCSDDIMNPGSFGQITNIDCGIADGFNTTIDEANACRPEDYDCRYSPILVRVGGPLFDLTGIAEGVGFDLNADGRVDLVGWTAADSGIGFLWLDRNGNGQVDDGSELFGNATPLKDGSLAANGFEALREFDDNGDGIIDRRDRIWSHLRLWVDANHDGRIQAGEILGLDDAGIVAFELQYRPTGRADRFGNLFRWESFVWRRGKGSQRVRESVYDVIFVHR